MNAPWMHRLALRLARWITGANFALLVHDDTSHMSSTVSSLDGTNVRRVGEHLHLLAHFYLTAAARVEQHEAAQAAEQWAQGLINNTNPVGQETNK